MNLFCLRMNLPTTMVVWPEVIPCSRLLWRVVELGEKLERSFTFNTLFSSKFRFEVLCLKQGYGVMMHNVLHVREPIGVVQIHMYVWS